MSTSSDLNRSSTAKKKVVQEVFIKIEMTDDEENGMNITSFVVSKSRNHSGEDGEGGSIHSDDNIVGAVDDGHQRILTHIIKSADMNREMISSSDYEYEETKLPPRKQKIDGNSKIDFDEEVKVENGNVMLLSDQNIHEKEIDNTAQENYKSQFGKQVSEKEDTNVMKNKQDSSPAQDKGKTTETAEVELQRRQEINTIHAQNHDNNHVQEVVEFNNFSSNNNSNSSENNTTEMLLMNTDTMKDYDGNDVKVVQQLIRNVKTENIIHDGNVDDDGDDDDDVIENILNMENVKSYKIDTKNRKQCADDDDGTGGNKITSSLTNNDNYKNNSTVDDCGNVNESMSGGGDDDGNKNTRNVINDAKPQIKRKDEQKNEQYQQQIPPIQLPPRPSTTQTFKFVNTHSTLMNRCRSASSLSSSVFKRKELENEDYQQHHHHHRHHQTAELHFESKVTTTNNIELNTKVDITSSESGGNNVINNNNANDDGCDENGLVKIDWKKVVTFLKCGPTSGKLKLLQAIRWRITKYDRKIREKTLREIKKHDLFGLANDWGESTILEQLLWQQNVAILHPLQDTTARLLNAIVSTRSGRTYIEQFSIIPILVWDEAMTIDGHTADMLIASIMKLSLSGFQRHEMIKMELIQWLINHLNDVEGSASAYHLEYSTALLMMLLTFHESDEIIVERTRQILYILGRFLQNKTNTCWPYIRASLLALFRNQKCANIARTTHFSLILKRVSKSIKNADERKQIESIIFCLDSPSHSHSENIESCVIYLADDKVYIDREIEAEDPVCPGVERGDESGEEFLREKFVGEHFNVEPEITTTKTTFTVKEELYHEELHMPKSYNETTHAFDYVPTKYGIFPREPYKCESHSNNLSCKRCQDRWLPSKTIVLKQKFEKNDLHNNRITQNVSFCENEGAEKTDEVVDSKPFITKPPQCGSDEHNKNDGFITGEDVACRGGDEKDIGLSEVESGGIDEDAGQDNEKGKTIFIKENAEEELIVTTTNDEMDVSSELDMSTNHEFNDEKKQEKTYDLNKEQNPKGIEHVEKEDNFHYILSDENNLCQRIMSDNISDTSAPSLEDVSVIEVNETQVAKVGQIEKGLETENKDPQQLNPIQITPGCLAEIYSDRTIHITAQNNTEESQSRPGQPKIGFKLNIRPCQNGIKKGTSFKIICKQDSLNPDLLNCTVSEEDGEEDEGGYKKEATEGEQNTNESNN